MGIDSTEGNAWQDTKILPDTFTWLDENLPKLDQRKPTILFTHFPLGADVPMRPLNADDSSSASWTSILERSFAGISMGIPSDLLESRDHDGSLLLTRPWQSRWKQGKGWFVCRANAAGDVDARICRVQAVGCLKTSALVQESDPCCESIGATAVLASHSCRRARRRCAAWRDDLQTALRAAST